MDKLLRVASRLSVSMFFVVLQPAGFGFGFKFFGSRYGLFRWPGLLVCGYLQAGLDMVRYFVFVVAACGRDIFDSPLKWELAILTNKASEVYARGKKSENGNCATLADSAENNSFQGNRLSFLPNKTENISNAFLQSGSHKFFTVLGRLDISYIKPLRYYFFAFQCFRERAIAEFEILLC
jgi:hypothetical protein